MNGIRRLLKTPLGIVLILSILSTFSLAQTVPVQGTADVSSIQAQIDQLTARVDALESPSPSPGVPDTPDPGDPIPDPTPQTPDSIPPRAARAVGMNLDFVGRSNGTHPDNPSAPGYDELLKAVAAPGGVRFMNPNRINDYLTAVDSLDDPHFYKTQTWRQALTWQAQLCRRIGADFYYNAPFHASSQFNTDAVALIRSILDDDQVIYVAWANEVWNASFAVYQEVKRITGVDVGGGAGLAFFDYWAKRLDETWTAARVADPNCVRVLETKTARDGTWFTDKLHDRVGGYDAVAITTYFSPHPSDYFDGITLDQVFAAARDNWHNNERPHQLAGIQWATDHGKRAISYEGGQHFFDPARRASVVEVIRLAQLDPRIADLRDDVLDSAFDAGLVLHLEFSFVGWWNNNGHWGQTNSVAGMKHSLKYQRLVDYARRLAALN